MISFSYGQLYFTYDIRSVYSDGTVVVTQIGPTNWPIYRTLGCQDGYGFKAGEWDSPDIAFDNLQCNPLPLPVEKEKWVLSH